MARDGSGNYSLPAGQPAVTGTTISASTFNTAMSDVAAALTASIAKDGQTTPTADLPMGTHKHTGVGDGSARTHYPSVGQIQDGGLQLAGSVGGTANAITATLTPAITTYVAGMRVALVPTSDNTGAVTLALNGLAAKTIKNSLGNDLSAGQIKSGVPVLVIYSGTLFVLVGADQSAGSFTGTLTGCTTSPTGSIAWKRSGRFIALQFTDSILGTSNSTAMTITGLPADLSPGLGCLVPIFSGLTDSGAQRIGHMQISAGGTTLIFAILNSVPGVPSTTGFTSSGQKGITGGIHQTIYCQ